MKCAFVIFFLIFACIASVESKAQLGELQTNLSKLYGFAPNDIADASTAEIKRILEDPPKIKDATFAQFHGGYLKPKLSAAVLFSMTNYYRCAWATNGYLLSLGTDESQLNQLTALGDTMGRFGNTNWHASGSAIVFEDSLTDKTSLLGEDLSSLARQPLKLGIFPLIVGSANFLDNIHFTAMDELSKKAIHGQIIQRDGNKASGIEYEVEAVPGYSYVVVFFKANESELAGTNFPIGRWVTYAVGNGKTNLIAMTTIFHIEVTRDALPDDYFAPSSWMAHTSAIPVVKAYAYSNQLMIPLNGQMVSVGSLEKFEVLTDHPERRRIILAVLLIVATLPPVLFLVSHFKRKISRSKNQQK